MWSLGENGSALGSGSGVFDNTTVLDPQDNVTLSCAARSIQNPVQQPYPDTIVILVRVCQSILLFLTSFTGVFLNSLIIFLVAKYKKLKTLSFGIAIQIAASDVIYSLNLIAGAANSIANHWLFGAQLCGLFGGSLFLAATVRTLALFIFVIDRFLSVFMPFSYPKYQKIIIYILSFFTWVALGMATVAEYALDCFEFIPNSWLCLNNRACNQYCTAADFILITIIIGPATIAPVFLYTALFLKAKIARKAMVVTAANGNKPAYNWKATITFFLMFLASFVFTLPNILLLFITRFAYGEEAVPLAVYLLLVSSSRLLTFVPVADAIVVLRNADVKEVIKAIKDKVISRWCHGNKEHTN